MTSHLLACMPGLWKYQISLLAHGQVNGLVYGQVNGLVHGQVNGLNPLVQPKFTCPKIGIFFLFLEENLCCGYSLEVPL